MVDIRGGTGVKEQKLFLLPFYKSDLSSACNDSFLQQKKTKHFCSFTEQFSSIPEHKSLAGDVNAPAFPAHFLPKRS